MKAFFKSFFLDVLNCIQNLIVALSFSIWMWYCKIFNKTIVAMKIWRDIQRMDFLKIASKFRPYCNVKNKLSQSKILSFQPPPPPCKETSHQFTLLIIRAKWQANRRTRLILRRGGKLTRRPTWGKILIKGAEMQQEWLGEACFCCGVGAFSKSSGLFWMIFWNKCFRFLVERSHWKYSSWWGNCWRIFFEDQQERFQSGIWNVLNAS